MIGLDYDEDSQAGQGALSHRIRLEEIDAQLVQQRALLTQAEEVTSTVFSASSTRTATITGYANRVKTTATGIATIRCCTL